MTPHSLLTAAVVAMCAASTVALAAPHAHTHGEAQAEMSLERNQLSLALTLPMEVLVGFERAPRGDAETQRWNQALGQLGQTDALWSLTPAAACKAQPPKTDLPTWGKQAHTDVVVTYTWQCDQPQALDRIQTQLFERFKRLRRVELAHVTPKGQGMTRLTPKKPQWVAGTAP